MIVLLALTFGSSIQYNSHSLCRPVEISKIRSGSTSLRYQRTDRHLITPCVDCGGPVRGNGKPSEGWLCRCLKILLICSISDSWNFGSVTLYRMLTATTTSGLQLDIQAGWWFSALNDSNVDVDSNLLILLMYCSWLMLGKLPVSSNSILANKNDATLLGFLSKRDYSYFTEILEFPVSSAN